MTAIVILAAGGSRRLGSPKQNLNFNGQTLLQSAIKNALQVSETVIVVLGAHREDIAYSIQDQPVQILNNVKWTEGMSTSITMTISELQTAYLQVHEVILMVCDQPYADATLLNQLLDKGANSEKGIIASAYEGTIGVPALFKAKYFPYLLALKGDEGAKALLTQHADDVDSVDFPQGSIDIDTPEDKAQLHNQ